MDCLKMYTVMDGNIWVATIMAERFEPKYGHFFIGDDVVGNTDSRLRVYDSGGRANYSFTPRAVQHCYDEGCACHLSSYQLEEVR